MMFTAIVRLSVQDGPGNPLAGIGVCVVPEPSFIRRQDGVTDSNGIVSLTLHALDSEPFVADVHADDPKGILLSYHESILVTPGVENDVVDVIMVTPAEAEAPIQLFPTDGSVET
jgi:hypothetical protein